MVKILIVFILGLIEQILYTAYLISVDKRQVYKSSFLMLIYMSLYLIIVAWAIKDANTIILLTTYALACGLGNLVTMKWETRRKK